MFVDKEYHVRMERQKILNPEGYKIYGLGQWGETSGLILSNWEVSNCNRDVSHYDAFSYGQDFGYKHANVILSLGYKDGDIYIVDEMYLYEKTNDQIIKLADEKKLYKNITMWCDSAYPASIKMWRDNGYFAKPVKKEKGSIISQINYLMSRKIYVNGNCVNVIKELQQWKWKKDEITNNYVDEPVENNDDAMAALRYGIEEQRKPTMWSGYN